MSHSRIYCPHCRALFSLPADAPADPVCCCPHCGNWVQVTVRGPTVLGADKTDSSPPHAPVPARDTPASRFPSWKWAAGLALVVGGCALLVLAAVLLAQRPARVDLAEKRSAPRGREEEIVRAYILNNADDPKSVTFSTWGPHSIDGEFEPVPLIRVRFRAANKQGASELFDCVYALENSKVREARPNAAGDDWLSYARQVRRRFEDMDKARRARRPEPPPVIQPAPPP